MSNILQQILIGIQCQDFVMIAADQTNVQSFLLMNIDENKIFPLSDHMIIGLNGDPADMVQFSHYIKANLSLYRVRNLYNLGPDSTAHYVRNTFADGLRNGSPYVLNALLGSYEPQKGFKLWLMDFWGTSVKISYAAHGIGGLFSIGILDNYYRPDLTKNEAYSLIKSCTDEIHKRLYVQAPVFQVSLVNRNGIMELPPIIPTTTCEPSRYG